MPGLQITFTANKNIKRWKIYLSFSIVNKYLSDSIACDKIKMMIINIFFEL